MADDQATETAQEGPLALPDPPQYVRFHKDGCGGVLPSEKPDDLDTYPDARAEWIFIVGLCACPPPHEPWSPPAPGELTYLKAGSRGIYEQLHALHDPDPEDEIEMDEPPRPPLRSSDD